MKRKLLLILALAVMLGLGGCGNKNEYGGTDTLEAVASTTTEETAAQPSEESVKVTEESKEETKQSAPGSSEPGSLESTDNKNKSRETAESKSGQGVKGSQESKAPEGTKASAQNTAASGSGKANNTGKSTDNSTASTTPGQSGGGNSDSKPVAHICDFGSGTVTTAATCSSDGVKTYTCSCGKTRTEAIPKTGHNYVTETKGATCTEAGSTKTYCSNCGAVQSETAIAATGHSMIESWFGDKPTCTHGGYLTVRCDKCGYVESSTSVPALEHTRAAEELEHGNCCDLTRIRYYCSVCGTDLGHEEHTEPGDHDWVTGEGEIWNPETHEMEKVSVTACSRCGARQ